MNKINEILSTLDVDAFKAACTACNSIIEVAERFSISDYLVKQLCKKLEVEPPQSKFISFEALSQSVSPDEFMEYWNEHSKEDTKSHFHIGGFVFNKYIKFFGLKKDKDLINELRNQTNLVKYGVENQFQRRDNISKSYIKKYGSVENKYRIAAEHAKQRAQAMGFNSMSQTPEVKRARKETCLQRYGATAYPASEAGVAHIKATKKERYGDETYHNIEQMKKTNLERYGVKHNWASSDPKLNGRQTKLELYGDEFYSNPEKSMKTCLERYGEDHYIKQVELMQRSPSSRTHSLPNKEFASYLLEQGIFFTPEFQIGDYFYDFRTGHYVIEVDPYATHNSSWGFRGGNPKSESYHREKTQNALDAGFKCIHIFDWVNPGVILYGIVTETLDLVDTGKPVKHIYDFKKKELTNEETENTVVIYDDGFDVIY